MSAPRRASAESTVDPLSAEFFDAMYRARDDPWDFATSRYERRRYADVLDLVGPGPHRRAFEPGCSIGELTRLLAPRCAALIAIDHAPTAVHAARRRCADLPHVDVRVGRLPVDVPSGRFDLVVFCEIGYYFDTATLARVVDRLVAGLEPGGRLVATHWTGRSDDHVLDGPTVHATIESASGLQHVAGGGRDGYVAGVWQRTPCGGADPA